MTASAQYNIVKTKNEGGGVLAINLAKQLQKVN